MEELLTFAKQIVYQAGLYARGMLPKPRLLPRKDNDQIVTEGDAGVEEYIISALRRRFPAHGFDSEEGVQERTEAEFVWVLDPIDGTRYYARDVPLYAISLALKHYGKLVLGVVYAPESGRMYGAVSNQGATVNGRPLRCSSEHRLDRVSVYLEIPSKDSPPDHLQWAMDKMAMLIGCTHRVRILGLGSLGLCFCAAGGFDVYVNLGSALKRFDVAAGRVILEEAGGTYLQFGEKSNRIIAGPPALCTQIGDLVGLV